MLTHYGGTEAVRRSSAETILFLQERSERAPEPRHDPEWRSLPCRSGEDRSRLRASPKLGVGEGKARFTLDTAPQTA